MILHPRLLICVLLSAAAPVRGGEPIPKSFMGIPDDDKLTLWDVDAVKVVGQIPHSFVEDSHSIRRISHSTGVVNLPDGRVAVALSPDKISLLDPTSWREVRALSWPGFAVQWFCPSPDGRTLAVQIWDRVKYADLSNSYILICDIESGKTLRRVRCNTLNAPGQFVRGGTLLATHEHDRDIHVYDVATLSLVRKIDAQPDPIPRFATSVNDRTLLVIAGGLGDHLRSAGGFPKTKVCTIDPTTGREITRFVIPDPWVQGVFGQSPDGHCLAFSGGGPRIGLWEMATGACLRRWPLTAKVARQVRFASSAAHFLVQTLDDKVEVKRVDPANWTPPRASVAATAWADLASDDGPKAFQAIWDLSALPNQAMPLLKQHVRPVEKVTPQRLTELIAAMDGDHFRDRQEARRTLAAIGPPAAPAVRQSLETTTSVELKRVLPPLLAELDNALVRDGPTRQQVRAVWVLQRIGTPEARELLKKLADGEPLAQVTRSAQQSLRFLNRTTTAAPR